jgi:hypothetical protein
LASEGENDVTKMAVILSKFYLRENNGIADDKQFPFFEKSNLWQCSSLAPGVFYPSLSFASGNSVSILVILLSAAFPYGSVPFYLSLS